MKRSMLKIFTALIAVGMLNCNAPTPIVDQGPGSETVAIRGTIVMADGSPVPNALVHVFPANYDPIGDSALSASYLDTTDQNGHYDFTNLTNGNYNVQAIQPQNGLRMLRCKVSVDSADTAIADVDTLQIPGAIKVDLPDSVNYLTGYVFVP
ncbi:MAG TPA: carboxypeptidase-like regulatory domain-containing protein, partial [Armatimonadota bacterium]|nr:carboxypeptidase-like regulatory domain-containing protein [Armatimonadota bacterium]